MSNIFRDPTEGASARRQDLLRRRRDELVTMPHAIRRVYIARRARTAASLIVLLGGIGMLVTAASPRLTHLIAGGLPGINPAVLSTFLVGMWIAGVFAYAAARALDEHRFAVAMSRYVMPSQDIDDDLERLTHEHPDRAAREMAHRLEVRSAAMPVIAAGVLLPATALFLRLAARAHGWPAIANVELTLATHVKPLIASGVVGAIVAIVMTKRFARVPAAAPVGGVVAIAAIVLSFTVWHWFAAGAALAGTIALVARRLRKERVQLEAEDPAAGSEIFTLRGFIRQVRDTTKRYATRRNAKYAAVTTAVLMLALVPTGLRTKTKARAQVAPAASAAQLQQVIVPMTAHDDYSVDKMDDGLHITVTISEAGGTVWVKDLAGLAAVPPQWRARVEVISESVGLEIELDKTRYLLDGKNSVSLSSTACDMKIHSLAFGVTAKQPGRYTLVVSPTLQPAGC